MVFWFDIGDVPLVIVVCQNAVRVKIVRFQVFNIQVVSEFSVTCISAVYTCRRICTSRLLSDTSAQ